MILALLRRDPRLRIALLLGGGLSVAVALFGYGMRPYLARAGNVAVILPLLAAWAAAFVGGSSTPSYPAAVAGWPVRGTTVILLRALGVLLPLLLFLGGGTLLVDHFFGEWGTPALLGLNLLAASAAAILFYSLLSCRSARWAGGARALLALLLGVVAVGSAPFATSLQFAASFGVLSLGLGLLLWRITPAAVDVGPGSAPLSVRVPFPPSTYSPLRLVAWHWTRSSGPALFWLILCASEFYAWVPRWIVAALVFLLGCVVFRGAREVLGILGGLPVSRVRIFPVLALPLIVLPIAVMAPLPGIFGGLTPVRVACFVLIWWAAMRAAFLGGWRLWAPATGLIAFGLSFPRASATVGSEVSWFVRDAGEPWVAYSAIAALAVAAYLHGQRAFLRMPAG